MIYPHFSRLFLILFSLFLISCNNETETNEENTITHISRFKAKYMEYPDPLTYMPSESEPEIVTLEYDNGKIVKKMGDIIYGVSTSGIPYMLSKKIYAHVAYANNKITITKKFTVPDMISNYKKELFLSGNQIEKIVKYDPNQNSGYDTISIYYNNQKIIKTISRYNYPKGESVYHYNSNNNLDSIITRYYQYDDLTDTMYIDYNSKSRNKITFSEYDNADNPLKNLIIFDETYYRALSQNNYKKIKYQSFNNTGTVISSTEKNWNLIYQNGNVDFSQ